MNEKERAVNAEEIKVYAEKLRTCALDAPIVDIEKLAGLIIKRTLIENRTHHLGVLAALVEKARAEDLNETRRLAIQDVATRILESLERTRRAS